ncbi:MULTISPECIES: hypothetical protein [unclassified Nocardioides]|uniref:hypothetical protein n=1 Tax=unclassified Nocardioides TaxID=2615069 RepID=UPI00301535DA
MDEPIDEDAAELPRPDSTTLQILRALAGGATIAEAALRCHVADSTLRRKLANLRVEWSVETNMQLVVLAIRRGLI